jgi:hypothetical protein
MSFPLFLNAPGGPQIVSGKVAGTNLGSQDIIQCGDLLVAVNGRMVEDWTVGLLSDALREEPLPLTLTFHNPYAVDADIARVALRPDVCTYCRLC